MSSTLPRLALGAAMLLLAASGDVEAQPAAKIARLGVLLFAAPEADPNLPSFRQGLTELG